MTSVLPPRHVHANVPIVSAADLHLVELPIVGHACEPPFDGLPRRVRGRDDKISKLRDLATAPSGGVAVLSGPAGCGKTTIALAAARRLVDDHRVFWVPGHNHSSFLDGMAAVARRLRASSAEIARAREEGSADLAWRLLTAQPSAGGQARNILVIDNVDEPDLASDVIHRALALVPAQWLTVVTTRTKATLSGLKSVITMDVNWPSKEACAHLLLDRIRELDKRRRKQALPSARQAVDLLGRVPLALHLAGSNQGSPIARHTLTDYVGELSRVPARRPGLRSGEPAYHLLPAMNLALGAFAPAERDTALQLLGLLAACAPGQPFPLGALIAAAGPGVDTSELSGGSAEPLVLRSVRLLAQTGLVDVTTVGERDGPAIYDDLRVAVAHPLIAKAALHVDGVRAASARIVGGSAAGALDVITEGIDTGSAEYVEPGADTWPLWRLLVSHVWHVLSGPGSDGPGSDSDVAAVRTAHRAIHHLMSRGMYRTAAELAAAAVERVAHLPEEHEASRRTALLDHGLALQAGGDDLRRAFSYINDVALRTRRECRPDDPEAMTAGHCLAAILHEMGDLSAAERLFRQVLDAREGALGRDHLDTLTTMHCLSGVLQAAGRSGDAERMLAKVLAGRIRHLGRDHPDTLSTKHSIAYARQATGGPDSLQDAERNFSEVLDQRSRILGETHPNTLITRHNLAWIEQAKGHYALAEEKFRAVMEVQLVRLGKAHPHTVATAANLAWDLLQQKQFATARLLFTQVLKIRATRLGAAHPDTQTTRGNLGWLTYEEGDFHRAEHRFRKLLADRERLLGPDHPRTLTTRHNLALSLRSQRKLHEARDEFISVLADQERVITDSHDSTLATKYNLAVTLRMLNEQEWLTEAMALLDRVLETLRGRPDPDNPLLRQTKREIVTLLAIKSGRADVHELVDDGADGIVEPSTTTLDDPLVQDFVDEDIDDFVDPDLVGYAGPTDGSR